MPTVKEISTIIHDRILSEKDKLITDWKNPQQTNTRHLVIDNLLPEELCMEIYTSFPEDLNTFYVRNSFREKKKTSANMNMLSKLINDCLYAFQEKNVIDIISDITKISDIQGDKKLYAGGISAMTDGDFLNPHIDNSHDMERLKYRRLNLLYYVTPKWQPEDGGNFELWDKNIKIQKKISSNFNRLVIMETTKKSWHSVDKVITNNIRYCISNYYFSSKPSKGAEKNYFHVTSFTGRPEETLKKVYGSIDNIIRNSISSTLKFGRGKRLINKKNKP